MWDGGVAFCVREFDVIVFVGWDGKVESLWIRVRVRGRADKEDVLVGSLLKTA